MVSNPLKKPLQMDFYTGFLLRKLWIFTPELQWIFTPELQWIFTAEHWIFAPETMDFSSGNGANPSNLAIGHGFKGKPHQKSDPHFFKISSVLAPVIFLLKPPSSSRIFHYLTSYVSHCQRVTTVSTTTITMFSIY